MTFESKLKEYLKQTHHSDSDEASSAGLDAKRRADVFALAQSSCDTNTSETSERLKQCTTTDQSVQKLKTSGNKPKSPLRLYLPFAMAAMLLLAVVPVIMMKQTTHTKLDMQVNSSQVQEGKSTIPHSNNTLNTEKTKQSDNTLVHDTMPPTPEPISTEESEAIALTRQIMEGNIDMPVYEGDVSPELQAQPKLVTDDLENDSGMVIYIPEEYLESNDSR